MLCCLSGVLANKSIVYPRLNGAQFREIGDAITDWSFPGSLRRLNPGSGFAIHEAGDGPDKVLYFGDSNMQQYWPRIEMLLRDRKTELTVVFATSGGCVPIPEVNDTHHPYCDGFAKSVIELAKDPAIKTVVIAAAWLGYFNNSQYRVEGVNGGFLTVGTPAWNEAFARLSRMINGFKAQGKSVWLVLNMPTGPGLAPAFALRRSIFGAVSFAPLQLELRKFETSWGPIKAKLIDAASSAGARIIDPMSSLCSSDVTCPGQTPEGRLMYKDGGHLRSSFVRDHASFVDPTFEIGPHAVP